MSMRHSRRRYRHIELKADAVVLLDRIAALGLTMQDKINEGLRAEIAEMRMRLAPPPGIKAPIRLTGYSRRKA